MYEYDYLMISIDSVVRRGALKGMHCELKLSSIKVLEFQYNSLHTDILRTSLE